MYSQIMPDVYGNYTFLNNIFSQISQLHILPRDAWPTIISKYIKIYNPQFISEIHTIITRRKFDSRHSISWSTLNTNIHYTVFPFLITVVLKRDYLTPRTLLTASSFYKKKQSSISVINVVNNLKEINQNRFFEKVQKRQQYYNMQYFFLLNYAVVNYLLFALFNEKYSFQKKAAKRKYRKAILPQNHHLYYIQLNELFIKYGMNLFDFSRSKYISFYKIFLNNNNLCNLDI